MNCSIHGKVKAFEKKCLYCFGKHLLFGWCNDCNEGFDFWKTQDVDGFGHGDCKVNIIEYHHNDHKEMLDDCYIDGCLSEVRL